MRGVAGYVFAPAHTIGPFSPHTEIRFKPPLNDLKTIAKPKTWKYTGSPIDSFKVAFCGAGMIGPVFGWVGSGRSAFDRRGIVYRQTIAALIGGRRSPIGYRDMRRSMADQLVGYLSHMRLIFMFRNSRSTFQLGQFCHAHAQFLGPEYAIDFLPIHKTTDRRVDRWLVACQLSVV